MQFLPANQYSIDPATGLTKDYRLPSYLQDLTLPQLNTYITGGDVTADLRELLIQDQTATGAGWLPCGNGSNDPCDASSSSKVMNWLVPIGLVLGGLVLLNGVLRK